MVVKCCKPLAVTVSRNFSLSIAASETCFRKTQSVAVNSVSKSSLSLFSNSESKLSGSSSWPVSVRHWKG